MGWKNHIYIYTSSSCPHIIISSHIITFGRTHLTQVRSTLAEFLQTESPKAVNIPQSQLGDAPKGFDLVKHHCYGIQKHQSICSNPRSWPVDRNVEPLSQIVTSWVAQLLICSGRPTKNRCLVLTNWMELILWRDISSCTWSRMPR